MRTNTQVQAIIFKKEEHDYKFLLLKRIKEKGGFWQPVTGGIESTDASKLDAIHREIFEETGIKKESIIRTIKDLDYFEFDKHYLTGEPIDTIKEYVYAFEVKPNIIISINNNCYKEHDEFRWVTYEEALKMLKWKENKSSFEKLYGILKND